MIDRAVIEAKVAEYRRQEEIAATNVHRLRGARLALEQLLHADGFVESIPEPATISEE